MGHARALINIDTIDKQLYVYDEVKSRQLSVRQTEELVRNLYRSHHTTAVKSSANSTINNAYKRIEDNLASHFSTKVFIKNLPKGNGSITIEYYSQDELNKILELMNVRTD
jgi:ParB family chromosome partitioning protein